MLCGFKRSLQLKTDFELHGLIFWIGKVNGLIILSVLYFWLERQLHTCFQNFFTLKKIDTVIFVLKWLLVIQRRKRERVLKSRKKANGKLKIG